jgi:aubergine-like protein
LVYTKSRDGDDDDADEFVRTLQEAGKGYGIIVKEPAFYTAGKGYDSFSDALGRIKDIANEQIIVTLLNDKFEANYYPKLKKELYLKYGANHQNVKKGSLRKNAMSVASKILLQINAKLGEPLWRIIRKHPELDKKKIVIGGMAIYHKLIDKNKSCASFVGTTNPDMTKYYSNSKLMNTNEQRFAGLQDMVINWVRSYCLTNKTTPDYIVVFREGVGEGSIQNIMECEVAVVKKAVSVIGEKMKIPNYNPGVAFILVNRKINQRMFQAKGK